MMKMIYKLSFLFIGAVIFTSAPVASYGYDCLPPDTKSLKTIHTKDLACAVKLVSSGALSAETEQVMSEARDYAQKNFVENGAVVVDFDETLFSSLDFFESNQDLESMFSFFKWAFKGKSTPICPTFSFIHWAKKFGYKIIVLSGRPTILEKATKRNLAQYGVEYDYMFLRPMNKLHEKNTIFKLSVRKMIEEQYKLKIVVNIGDQETDFYGGYGKKFKLPNVFYYVP